MRWSAAQTLSWIMRQEAWELRQWTADMGPMIIDAQRMLASKIAAGQVQAWGRKQPHGLAEQIPTDPFRIPGLTVVVDVHGEMATVTARAHQPFSSYDGPRWHSIEFEATEIERAWPKPPPLSATEWMLREAERLLQTTRQPGKRDDMVRRCMKEAPCSKLDAIRAFNMLPGNLRRVRGKPPKQSG